MNIAIDISPLTSGHYLQHRVRGTGFYLKNLQKYLEKSFPNNKYIYFKRGDKLKNVDLVHYPYFEPFFLTLPFFSLAKTVVTVHDLTPLVFPEHFKAGMRGKVKWEIQKMALKNASAIITDSESSKKDIIKFTDISASKIKVVYLASDEEFSKTSDKANSKIVSKFNLPKKFILYVGDVTWNKNLPNLIKAVKSLDIPLVMVGNALVQENIDLRNPWNRDYSEVLKLIDSDKKIIRLGFVEKDELISLYNLASLFLMPSFYEGFGLPILEAMGCGCPVVSSRSGSIPEVAGDACFYVDPKSVENIADGIRKVFTDMKLQKELSKKGLEQARKFSWEKTARETMAVYEDMVSKM